MIDIYTLFPILGSGTIITMLVAWILDRKKNKALLSQMQATADKTQLESEGMKIDIAAKLEEMRKTQINDLIEENKALSARVKSLEKTVDTLIKELKKLGADVHQFLQNGNGNGHH